MQHLCKKKKKIRIRRVSFSGSIGMQYACMDFYYLYYFFAKCGVGGTMARLHIQHEEVLGGYYIILHREQQELLTKILRKVFWFTTKQKF